MNNSSNYREVTGNILDGIRVETNWDTSPVSPYESKVAKFIVPGILEFSGFYREIRDLEESRLTVYSSFPSKPLRLFEEDFFPGLDDSQRLKALRGSDPFLLGTTVSLIYYHHEEISDGMFFVKRLCERYSPKPISNEMEKDIQSFLEMSGYPKKRRLDLELVVLREMAQKCLQGIKLDRIVK